MTEPKEPAYPAFIARCRSCGHRCVPIPLADYPLDVEAACARLQAHAGRACTVCGARDWVADQSAEALAWYDREVRPGAGDS